LALVGAKGPTRDEISQAFQISDVDRFAAQVGQALESFSSGGAKREFQLEVFNRAYLEASMKLEAAYAAKTRDVMKCPAEQVSFKSDAEGVRKRINAAVEKQTHGLITDLIPMGALDATSRLVLTNSVYFKGKWQSQFTASATHPMPFHGAKGESSVPTMSQRLKTGRWRGADGYSVLELECVPKLGGISWDDLIFWGILSAATLGTRLSWICSCLHRQAISERCEPHCCIRLPTRCVHSVHQLLLPKFTFATPSMTLNGVLRSLGISRAFDEYVVLSCFRSDV
jgi:serine protease inhibitor